jgi:electron transfer flavoprotein beta subunit
MTIVSCIKQVHDLDIILKNDWVVEEDGQTINIDYANRIMNTYDETSLELMLRLNDRQAEFQTMAVTIGGSHSETILRKALALGVEKAIRIEPSTKLDYSPDKVAFLLSDIIKGQNDVELVLCGRQADNGNNGQTGQILAEMLGWPCITMVTDIKKLENKYKISRMVEQGIEHLYVSAPLVVSVTQSENKQLRMATLKATLDARKKVIEQFDYEDLSLIEEYSKYKLERISINSSEKHCIYINDKENETKSDQLVKILKNHLEHDGQ